MLNVIICEKKKFLQSFVQWGSLRVECTFWVAIAWYSDPHSEAIMPYIVAACVLKLPLVRFFV